MEKLIRKFWECSENGRMDEFDFGSFFSKFQKRAKYKLATHGLLSFEDYLKEMNQYYNLNELKNFEYISKHTSLRVTHEDILKAIFKPRYLYFRRRHINRKVYKDILNAYLETKNYRRMEREERVLLADKCIHLEHSSRKIVDVIRKSYEKKIEELETDPIFNILTRRGFENHIYELRQPFDVALLDFVGISEMNSQLGYERVNRLFRKLFDGFRFREKDLIGRWFSGDEIAIATEHRDIERLIFRFREYAESCNLKFRYVIYNEISTMKEIQLEKNL